MPREEAAAFHGAGIVPSSRALPLILSRFQVKERDEPRPRAGVLRTREFIMKDSYSFDRDEAGLAGAHELHIEGYDRILHRSGLRRDPGESGRSEERRVGEEGRTRG